MRSTHIFLAGLILAYVYSSVFGVSTTKIDVVRGKSLLADTDTAIIDEFLSDAFTEFYEKADFSDIAALRNTIISKSTATTESAQIQYGPRYISAVQKQIDATFKKVNILPNNNRKNLLTLNLLILINDFGNLDMAKSSLDYIQSSNTIIRYWAINSLTNSSMVKQLNTGSESNLAKDIVQTLSKNADTEQSSDILIITALFASKLNQPAANELLTKIAQKRIDLYLNWKVNDEMTDNWILQALSDRKLTDPESVKLMAKNFATLYSLIIQRYALGENLSDVHKTNMTSVIAQAEKYVTNFIPEWVSPGPFKRALEKTGSAALLTEAEGLFGSASVAAGKLPITVGFDYGRNPDGSAKNAPPTLPKPPAAK